MIFVKDGSGNTVRRNRFDLRESRNECKPGYDLLNGDDDLSPSIAVRSHPRNTSLDEEVVPASTSLSHCNLSDNNNHFQSTSSPVNTTYSKVVTRSGRHIKAPSRLNL